MDPYLTEAANGAQHVRRGGPQHPMGGSLRAEAPCSELRILKCIRGCRFNEHPVGGLTRIGGPAEQHSPCPVITQLGSVQCR